MIMHSHSLGFRSLQNENASKVAWPLRKDNDSDEWETKPKRYATN